MHELSIASSILERVEEEAGRRPGSRVIKVGVRIGELSGVDPDALSFGFEALTQSWPNGPLALDIEFCPRRQRCRQCSHEFAARDSATDCPACGSGDTACVGGDELDIAYLDVEDP